MKANILIIDDNPKNIQLAATVLKNSGLYNIFFATSGQAGIDQLNKHEISLILLDINMPIMDGYETADIIKKDPYLQKIPIIFLSANANQESINSGFKHGAADYITKPFQEEEMLHRVSTHVELYISKQMLQDEVYESQSLLEQYKRAMDIALIVSKTDTKGLITYANDKFCEVSKYSLDELIGKPHNIVRHPDTPAETFKELWKTISSAKVWKGTLKNLAKDGSAYVVEATIIPIKDHNNKIVEYMAVRVDITEQVLMQQTVIDSLKEVLFTFGELGEMRSKETGDHVKRVSLFAELLAKAYGCPVESINCIKIAAPMHDIGKVVVPDSILLKPGKLSDEEFEIIKQHAQYGYDIFKNSSHKVLQITATIAHEHHEKWDGTGYPQGLKGEEISIFGRIVAIADVFDALCHERVYKEAWTLEKVIEYFKEERGKSFEPRLVDLLLENIDEVVAIKRKYNK